MAVVAVVTSAPPLTEGGHIIIARELVRALRVAGIEAGLVTTPSNRFGRQASAYLANYLTDVGRTGDGRVIDRVITLRYPAFAVRHPRQVCWLNHTMREYYDQWDRWAASLSTRGRLKEGMRRRLIHAADTHCLRRHASAVFAQSATVRERLRRWNGVDAPVLFPPAPARSYRCDDYGDYLFFVSRLTALKRADLVLRAMAEPAAREVRCVMAGDGEDRDALERLSRDLGLGDRVRFAGRVPEDELVDHLARCRGVVFVPVQEDYGFVTAEAFASAKPVITCRDSGGPAELVRDGENGLLTEPTPAALAGAMATLAASRAEAERLGRRAQVDGAQLTWDAVVDQLMSA